MRISFYEMIKTLKFGLNTEGLQFLIKTTIVSGKMCAHTVHAMDDAQRLYVSVFLCAGECCTHWHGLAAVQGADCRLSLSMCGELDEGATWEREQMHAAHVQAHKQVRTHTHTQTQYT